MHSIFHVSLWISLVLLTHNNHWIFKLHFLKKHCRFNAMVTAEHIFYELCRRSEQARLVINNTLLYNNSWESFVLHAAVPILWWYLWCKCLWCSDIATMHKNEFFVSRHVSQESLWFYDTVMELTRFLLYIRLFIIQSETKKKITILFIFISFVVATHFGTYKQLYDIFKCICIAIIGVL